MNCERDSVQVEDCDDIVSPKFGYKTITFLIVILIVASSVVFTGSRNNFVNQKEMIFWEKLKKSWIYGEKHQSFKLKEIFSRNTKEFCRETSIHGMKYVADNNLRPSERCFFGISIVTVICIVIYLIAKVYDKWSTSPVIVGVNPEPTFIADEPFPAVTICNMNQALDKVARTFPKDSLQYIMLSLLCRREVNSEAAMTITNWSYVGEFIVEISQPCKDMFIDCQFGGKKYPCEELFYPIVTDEGLCCVFNMLHPTNMYVSNYPLSHPPRKTDHDYVIWHAETGYPEDLPPLFFPKKVPGAGVSKGLSVTLDVELDKYYCSSTSSVGFIIALHTPDESPNLRETGVFIEPGKETKLRILPEKSETEKTLRSTKVHLRHCLFRNEINLKAFAHYTQRNCEMECVSETWLKYCDCILYHMPKIYNNVTVCSISELPCLKHFRLQLWNKTTTCLDACLPACYDMNFQVNSFSTKLAPRGYFVNSKNLGNRSRYYVVENVAVVHMFFKENSYRSNLKTEFFGMSNFLSSIGGLMGLFLGFSFLSIAECIFYAILRPYRSVRHYQNSTGFEGEVHKQRPPSLKRSKKVRQVLRTRYRRIFGNGKLQKDRNSSMLGPRSMVPYSIAYGFDASMKNKFYISDYIE